MWQRLDKQTMKRPKKICTKVVRRTLACFYISVLQGKMRNPPSFSFPPWCTQLDFRRLAFLAPGIEHLVWLPAFHTSLVTFAFPCSNTKEKVPPLRNQQVQKALVPQRVINSTAALNALLGPKMACYPPGRHSTHAKRVPSEKKDLSSGLHKPLPITINTIYLLMTINDCGSSKSLDIRQP